MREQLNDNPVAQVAIVGALLALAAFFVFNPMKGGGEEEPVATPRATAPATAPEPPELAATPSATGAPAGTTGVPAVPKPPPRPVTASFDAGRTVVLLIVKRGGIDDAMTAAAVRLLRGLRKVSVFVVPASGIARYAAITQGVAVDRVPALIVVRPRRSERGVATASVSYGFQSVQSVMQAVIDARYRGRTLDYHP